MIVHAFFINKLYKYFLLAPWITVSLLSAVNVTFCIGFILMKLLNYPIIFQKVFFMTECSASSAYISIYHIFLCQLLEDFYLKTNYLRKEYCSLSKF